MTEPLAVLLHGWPGLPSDYGDVIGRVPDVRCVIPSLAGFGEGYAGPMPPGSATAEAHAARILSTLPEGVPLLAVGYDIGSRIAQAMMRAAPDRFIGAVLTPGYPGIGARAGGPGVSARFWYQHFHRTPVAVQLIDGRAEAVREYLRFLVESWAEEEITRGQRFDDVVAAYARPGAFGASIAWYRDNVGYTGTQSIDVPTTMLWPEHDPLFPLDWADELEAWFTDVELRPIASGHFVPLEAPGEVADAIERHIRE